MITDQMVERAAEALWAANSKDRFGKWNGLGGEWKDKWRDDARAALTGALGDAVVVPPRHESLGDPVWGTDPSLADPDA